MTLKDTPAAAKKSAVIISQDGEIEQHIDEPNENILGSELETEQVEAPPTINQVVYVNPASFTEEPQENIPIHKIDFMRLWVPVIMLVLLVPIYLLFSSSDDSDTEKPAVETVAIVSPVVEKIENHPQSISELKHIANEVLEDDQQVTANVDLFVDNWNLMDDFSKQDFSNSFWMERFRNLLAQKIETFNSSDDKYSTEHTDNYRNSLVNMASVIRTLESISTPSANDTNEFEEIFKEISTELAMAELEKKLTEAKSKLTPEETDEESLSANSTTNPIVKTSTKGFTVSDVNYLLGQYATTYEFGSTKKIMKLFSAKSGYKKALTKNFKKVFSYSSDRHIRFSKFEWQFFNNSIVGHGKYHARITLKKDKGVRHVRAKIRVKFIANEDDLKIARMNFSNVKVQLDKAKPSNRRAINFSARKNKSKATSKSTAAQKKFRRSDGSRKSKLRRMKTPTAAELQDIVMRFIGAYESGNISALDKIFSKNAKTNDQNGLSEIKKDYRILFQTTSDRQLFIQDIKWTIVDNNARGKGVLNLLIVADGSNSIDSQHGVIKITAQKKNDKLLITHLFHDLRN